MGAAIDYITMGKRKQVQECTSLMADDLPRAPTVPFYDQLNRLLDQDGFDDFTAKTCNEFYADKLGRPSLPPGAYFRMLLGYLLGLDSERGLAP